MACGVCGSAGHNRRTHAEHDEPQDQALMSPEESAVPVISPLVSATPDENPQLSPTRFLVGERGPVMGHVVVGVWTADAQAPHDDESADWSDHDVDEPSADFTVARCQECGEPLDDGQSFLCGSCAVQDQHQCEPAPDQVAYCRHCGGDLMVEDDAPGPYPTPPWRTVLGPDEPIRITLPGVYELTAEEYHDPAVTGLWVSNSDLRAMSAPHCPAKWKYNRDNGVRVINDAFSFGHAWHARVLGKGETIAVRPAFNPADPEDEWDSWRKNSAKKWRAEQEAAGRSVILPEDWAAVEAMATAIYDREESARLLAQPGRPELAMFWVDPATGVKRRALVDFMPDRPNADGVLEIVDIKSTDSASPDDDMERKIYKYAYFRQGVTIMDGAIALGLAEDATVFFIFQEKTAPYLVQEVELDVQAQLAGSIENHRALMVYKKCLETGVWPSYAPGPVTLSLPPYILARYEDDIEVH